MPDEEAVENDEELAARLHRELNGLNRRAGRVAAVTVVGPVRRKRVKAVGSDLAVNRSKSRPVPSPVGSSSGFPHATVPGGVQEEQDTSRTPTGPDALSRSAYAMTARSAASIIRTKARLSSGSQTGPYLKCFIVGYRWGISVRRSHAGKASRLKSCITSILTSQSAAASFLKIRDECGVILLDGEGRQSYFPSNETHTTCAWESAIKIATRAYLM